MTHPNTSQSPSHTHPPLSSMWVITLDNLLCTQTHPYPVALLPIGSGYFRAKPFPVSIPQHLMSKIPTFMQQFKCLFHLSSCSTCFGRYIHPSSGASRMYRRVWYNSSLSVLTMCRSCQDRITIVVVSMSKLSCVPHTEPTIIPYLPVHSGRSWWCVDVTPETCSARR